VHGRLIGSAFATAPVVCLTLAKWETVSGQFGGYLIIDELVCEMTSLEFGVPGIRPRAT
jgi:hypothetical protein